MSGLFSGMNKLGLGNLSDLKVYDDTVTSRKDNKPTDKVQEEKAEFQEEDVLFDKTYTCPACDTEFKSKSIRTGKVKLEGTDTDLRPKYRLVDCLKYDAVVCPSCGYAALGRYFDYLTSGQVKLIAAEITSKFRGIEENISTYSYEEAISRHQLALVSSIVKKAKNSEKAYTCLKLAWLCRGYAETFDKKDADYLAKLKETKKSELEYLQNAYSGFSMAYSKEDFPLAGMDEMTMAYLLADISRRIGKYEDAMRWVSSVLSSRNANKRIKDKAMDLKDFLLEKRKKDAEKENS